MIPDTAKQPLRVLLSGAWAYVALLILLPRILNEAYRIRLHAITEYGPVIHEFDVSLCPNFECIEICFNISSSVIGPHWSSVLQSSLFLSPLVLVFLVVAPPLVSLSLSPLTAVL